MNNYVSRVLYYKMDTSVAKFLDYMIFGESE